MGTPLTIGTWQAQWILALQIGQAELYCWKYINIDIEPFTLTVMGLCVGEAGNTLTLLIDPN